MVSLPRPWALLFWWCLGPLFGGAKFLSGTTLAELFLLSVLGFDKRKAELTS